MEQMMAPDRSTAHASFLAGGGEMGELIRSHDWRASPLGAPEQWPQGLKTAVRLLLTSRHPMFIWWGDELIQFYNDSYRQTLGPERHPSALGQAGRQCWSEIWDVIGPQIDHVMSGQGATWNEDQLLPMTRHGQKEEVWWTYGFSPIGDEDQPGGVGGVLVVCSDVTERHRITEALKQREEQLRQANEDLARAVAERTAALASSEERFRQLASMAPGIVWYGNPDGTLSYLNEFWFSYTGQTPEEALPTGWASVLHPDDVDDLQAVWAAARASGTVYDTEARLRRHDGTYRWFLIRAEPVRDDQGRVTGWIGNDLDIQDRKVMEEGLRNDRDRMWRLSTDIMLVARFDGTIESVNPAWTSLFGWTEEDLVGSVFLDLVHPDDVESTMSEVGSLADGQTTWRFENRYRHKDGSYRRISWTAVPDESFIHAVGRDVTAERDAEAALRAAEKQLVQSQKMEAVGQLTGGVAHDFNNLLQVISGNLQLLARDVAGNERAELRVRNALSGVSRGSKLASSLLAFARRQPLEPKAVNLGRLIRSLDDMLRRALGEGIEIETVSGAGLWNTLVDPAQVENALLNLAINARDAMDGHGKLTIETGNASLDDHYAQRHAEVKAGQYVMLAVSDTGCGMAPDVLERVFEPFYSTKPEGKGTGLGLSMVYGFVKQSGGHVKIYSEPGQGTTIRLYLPRTHQEEDVATDLETGPARGGSETVLVVEDDDEVRAVVVEMLSDLGYRVLKAREAQSALAILESGVSVDLLFTDVVMPGSLRSPELARKARERLPNIAVLFTSGYTENAIVHGGRLDAGVELLSKPYTREALARKLRHVLRNQQQRNGARPATAVGGLSGPGGTAPLRVLLVEDDALIRMTTTDMLAGFGHSVLEAEDAEQALSILEAQAVDLLLTDLTLPGMSGDELALRVLERRPGLPVVFATGHDRPPGIEGQGPLAAATHLMKPYDAGSLAHALRMATRKAGAP
ncbi:PAS domain-containing protein [Azospirillum sp. SYSU D00513]|uniref:hybrid sensor histidine kinase/response regulator n=1 Tax=Azospirillum sp. SYSU D00513 TaxID=2812561 RepID=UPI001A95EA75|nr:PAS domain-containing protein [Azospirillum sp. SYSU D00513]